MPTQCNPDSSKTPDTAVCLRTEAQTDAKKSIEALSGFLAYGLRTHWAAFFVFFGLVAAVFSLWEVLAPFFAGAALAYSLNTPVKFLRTKTHGKLSAAAAASIVFITFIGFLSSALLLIVPVVSPQMALIEKNTPAIVDRINEKVIPWIAKKTPFDVSDQAVLKDKAVEFLSDNKKAVIALAGKVIVGSSSVMSTTGFLLITSFVCILLLPGFEVYQRAFSRAVPARSRKLLQPLVADIDHTLSAFLAGQLKLIVCLSLFYSCALALIGLQGGWALGLLTGILSIIPVIGPLAAAALAFLTAVLQVQQAYMPIAVLGVFVAGQMLEGLVLTPKIVGDKIGLSMLDVFFSLALLGYLFGMAGVLLALPIAASTKVALAYGWRAYQNSEYYKNN